MRCSASRCFYRAVLSVHRSSTIELPVENQSEKADGQNDEEPCDNIADYGFGVSIYFLQNDLNASVNSQLSSVCVCVCVC